MYVQGLNGVSLRGNSGGREVSQHKPLISEEGGFKINTKLQRYFLIMLFPNCFCFVSQKFISFKTQEPYRKAILKGISSSVHNFEEHLPSKVEAYCL